MHGVTSPHRLIMWLGAAAMAAMALAVAGCGGGQPMASTAATGRDAPHRVVDVILPLQLKGSNVPDSVAAIKLALADKGTHQGAVDVSVTEWSDSGPTGDAVPARSAAQATRAVADPEAIGVIGTMTSSGTKAMAPVINRTGMPLIGIAATAVALTRRSDGRAGPPAAMAPTGIATYARLVPNDDRQAHALAEYMQQEDVTDLWVLHDGGAYGGGIAAGVATAARAAGIKVRAVEQVGLDDGAARARVVARQMAAEGARMPAVFIAANSLDLSRAAGVAAAAADDRVLVFGPDSMAFRGVYGHLDPALERRFFITTYQLPISTYGPDGVHLFERMKVAFGREPSAQALYAYEAMALLLDSIKAALPNSAALSRMSIRQQRLAVTNAMMHTVDRGSVVGTYSIDLHGDTNSDLYGAYRVEGGELVRGQALQTDGGG